jgi:hypothetical protein
MFVKSPAGIRHSPFDSGEIVGTVGSVHAAGVTSCVVVGRSAGLQATNWEQIEMSNPGRRIRPDRELLAAHCQCFRSAGVFPALA